MASVDKSNMLAVLEDFPRQCKEAVETGRLAGSHLVIDVNHLNSLAILGMGGSGISGDVIEALIGESIKLPIHIGKGYRPVASIDENCLVFAVSYSGDTEETVEAAEEVIRRGAQLISVTSGGRLAELTLEHGLPLINIPAGFQPRAAIGYLALPMLVILNFLGLVRDFDPDINELLDLLNLKLNEWRSASTTTDNLAKRLARDLYGRLPIIYGSEGITGPAALRWKCQFNENSKVPAFWNRLPELNHNEITGWEKLSRVSREFFLISLRDSGEHPQVARRFAVTKELIADSFAGSAEINSFGNSNLARFFSLAYLGDFVSVYLAILNEVDPTPVDRIQLLKAKLAGDKPGVKS